MEHNHGVFEDDSPLQIIRTCLGSMSIFRGVYRLTQKEIQVPVTTTRAKSNPCISETWNNDDAINKKSLEPWIMDPKKWRWWTKQLPVTSQHHFFILDSKFQPPTKSYDTKSPWWMSWAKTNKRPDPRMPNKSFPAALSVRYAACNPDLGTCEAKVGSEPCWDPAFTVFFFGSSSQAHHLSHEKQTALLQIILVL